MSDAEENVAKKYTKNLAASMRVLKDRMVQQAFNRLMREEDELYETVEPPTYEEEIK